MNDLPKMPEGYYHLRGSDGHYVLIDPGVGPAMKRLQAKTGGHKRFDSPEEAAAYAHKHKAAGLAYDQEVSDAN
jgi:glyoxylase-like metal-dependent hydrolase (beta-lactamase superfamily II)